MWELNEVGGELTGSLPHSHITERDTKRGVDREKSKGIIQQLCSQNKKCDCLMARTLGRFTSIGLNTSWPRRHSSVLMDSSSSSWSPLCTVSQTVDEVVTHATAPAFLKANYFKTQSTRWDSVCHRHAERKTCVWLRVFVKKSRLTGLHFKCKDALNVCSRIWLNMVCSHRDELCPQ